ncbi:Dehydrogenase/reductase SDR family member 7 [Halotydeus destructor]|nr:Dehydrogenase/reductase SDR family member 7 [Halotydeus destructor]
MFTLILIFVALSLIYIWFQCDSDLTLIYYSYFGRPAADCRGKVIWITGASSGIGAELAAQLSKIGARLVLTARNVEKLEKVKLKCIALNSNVEIMVMKLDTNDTDSHGQCLQRVLAQYGKLDILVNNAGMWATDLFELTDPAVERNIFDTNVLNPISLTRTVVNYWLESSLRGHIAVTSSASGSEAFPTAAAYCATKHALEGYFKTLGIELFNRKIAVSIVCPGMVDTAIATSGRTGVVGERPEADIVGLSKIFPTMSTSRACRTVLNCCRKSSVPLHHC